MREIAKKNCDVIFTTSRNFTHIVAIFISINSKPVNEAERVITKQAVCFSARYKIKVGILSLFGPKFKSTV